MSDDASGHPRERPLETDSEDKTLPSVHRLWWLCTTIRSPNWTSIAAGSANSRALRYHLDGAHLDQSLTSWPRQKRHLRSAGSRHGQNRGRIRQASIGWATGGDSCWWADRHGWLS